MGLFRSVLSDLAGARPAARTALVESVTRVGESITFSAATVIAAVLTLLAASFPFYSNLGIPFAIAIAVTLLAGLTLLPALLSIRLSLLAIKRTLFQAMFHKPKLLPWSIQGRGGAGVWGRVAGRIVRRPATTLIIGVVAFGGLALAVLGYTASGFGGSTAPPAGSDSAKGTQLLTKYFPESAANPTTPIFKFSQPVWTDPQVLAKATSELRASSLFTTVAGPLNPSGLRCRPPTTRGCTPGSARPRPCRRLSHRHWPARCRPTSTSCTAAPLTSSAPTGGRCSSRSGCRPAIPAARPP